MTDSKNTHDAQKMLSDFRDHLGRHDKPIAYFFGAVLPDRCESRTQTIEQKPKRSFHDIQHLYACFEIGWLRSPMYVVMALPGVL